MAKPFLIYQSRKRRIKYLSEDELKFLAKLLGRGRSGLPKASLVHLPLTTLIPLNQHKLEELAQKECTCNVGGIVLFHHHADACKYRRLYAPDQ